MKRFGTLGALIWIALTIFALAQGKPPVLGINNGGTGQSTTTIIDPTLSQYGGGMKPGFAYADGVISAGSTTFCSNSATFGAGDAGKPFAMDYVGPGTDAIAAGGMPLVTTIVSAISANCVQLATPATQSTGNTNGKFSFITWWDAIESSVTSSYAPGQIVCVNGGVYTIQGCGSIEATQPTTITVNNGGGGAFSANGSASAVCQVQGTTGEGALKTIMQFATVNGSLTGSATIIQKGIYTVNPTDITNEPVVPVNGCVGLVGATVNMLMSPAIITADPTIPNVARGLYTTNPPAGAATTVSSGTGAGLTVNLHMQAYGAFEYGWDSQPALAAAISASDSINASGGQAVISIPAAHYMLLSPPPTSIYSACVIGAGEGRTWLHLFPGFTGDAFSWSEGWTAPKPASVGFQNLLGGIGPASLSRVNVCLMDMTISGDREGGTTQNGAIWYDHEDYGILEQVFFQNLNGYCFAFGLTKYENQAFTRESRRIDHDDCQYSGSLTTPAWYYTMSGTSGGASEIDSDSIDIYAPFGTCFQIDNTTNSGVTASFRDIRLGKIRCEGIQHNPVPLGAKPLFAIGSANTNPAAQIFGIKCTECQLTDAYFGGYALAITTSSGGKPPYQISFTQTTIAGGDNLGSGVLLDCVRNSSIQIDGMYSDGPNITVTSCTGAGNQVFGIGGNEQSFSYAGTSAQIALLNAWNWPGTLASAAVVAPGSGYALNDQLTLGASANPGMNCLVPPVLQITEVTPTFATSILNPGSCTTQGKNPLHVSSTTGSGTGATFTAGWSYGPGPLTGPP